ncbi:DHHA1 domain-containing protein [Aquibacillus albus]|uniref:Alanyl-tRNA synthetase n=1 Tax=Aquibacillus albus TaxID=1168171 RepID=A0ABS2N0K8_9BACI|nr:alanyl-tRNA synthetase [Aquibacillus albus]
MTKKLFYDDPYLQSFSAKVKKQELDLGGLYVVLDQTAFYPTGGGQPHDIGVIQGTPVVNVEDIDGEVRHYLEKPLSDPEKVDGEIDWDHRFDHMQQHAGQHILSASFEELFDLKTVSFHLGKEICTIDLNAEVVNDEQLEIVEDFANQVILENRPIETKWVKEEELKQYRLRKQLSVKENIRLVIIPELDYNGCGGTHPNSTGQVVIIKLLGWEKQRHHVRISFICGGRVREQFGQKHGVIRELSQLLNTPEPQLPETSEQLLKSRKQLDKTMDELKAKLLEYEANDLVHKATDKEKLVYVFRNRSIKELQKLAQQMTAETETSIIVLISENEDKLQLVCIRGKLRSESMKQFIQSILPLIDGKGGGNDVLAQGGGAASISGQELADKVREVMS